MPRGGRDEDHIEIYRGGAYAACDLRSREGIQNDIGVHRVERQRESRRDTAHAFELKGGGNNRRKGAKSGAKVPRLSLPAVCTIFLLIVIPPLHVLYT